jgi:hypothetical protein
VIEDPGRSAGCGNGHDRAISGLVVVVFALFFGELVALIYWAGGSIVQRLGFALSVIGAYSIGIGFFSRTDLAGESSLDEHLTSSNLRAFVAGNLTLLGVVYLMFSLAFRGQRSVPAGLLTAALVVPLFAFTAAYLLVVMPFAYVAHLLVSLITTGIIASPEDFTITGISEEHAISLRRVVTEHEGALKSFLVGVPAVLFGVVSAGLSVLT